ncbi:MAG TPA: GNAT family N-acetyltransferase, partial [Anaerolineae bacterium]|nr:GNAT family N-acetyltransferase [Anaerolineae bacterium]
MPISLHPASEFTTDQLTALLNASYDDYATPIRFRPHQFDFFIHAHDILLSQSLVAQAGDVPIGVVLLARREERGWVAGLGVAPEHRGRGVARALMSNVMEHARTLGLQRLQLEVLSDNAHARKLYEDLGWQLGRELLVWERDEEQGPLPIHRERAVKMEPRPLLEGLDGYRYDFKTPERYVFKARKGLDEEMSLLAGFVTMADQLAEVRVWR